MITISYPESDWKENIIYHIDLWTGSNQHSEGDDQISCEDNLPGGSQTIIKDPPSGLKVESTFSPSVERSSLFLLTQFTNKLHPCTMCHLTLVITQNTPCLQIHPSTVQEEEVVVVVVVVEGSSLLVHGPGIVLVYILLLIALMV